MCNVTPEHLLPLLCIAWTSSACVDKAPGRALVWDCNGELQSTSNAPLAMSTPDRPAHCTKFVQPPARKPNAVRHGQPSRSMQQSRLVALLEAS